MFTNRERFFFSDRKQTNELNSVRQIRALNREGRQNMLRVMGDPKTEEDVRGNEDSITLWPSGSEAIISSDLSVSHENRNNLMTRGTMAWPTDKQHMNNNPEEKSESNTNSLGSSASGKHSALHRAGLELSKLKRHTVYSLGADLYCLKGYVSFL